MTPVPFIRRPTTWAAAGGTYLTYAMVMWVVSGALGLRGGDVWVLRVALWLVGAIAAAIILWFLSGRRVKGEDAARAHTDELDAAVGAVAARLKAAGARHGMRGMPLVVVVGPAGSSKTTAVVNSGLEAELLAGEVYHGQGIGATPAINIWYSQRTLFLEVGGGLAAQPTRWARIIRHTRPQTLQATLTGKPQSPRAALVCFSCEEFLKAGSAEAVPAAARELRSMLLKLAHGYGVSLPVYVLFTKADRIPHFAEYAQHLTREESQQVLGATLRWPPRTSVSLYADREFERIHTAFERLLGALAAKRLDLLAREMDETRRGAMYEFPRELRKLVPGAAQFLVDLCRPAQLSGSPVLRGVYFTGVRPVVVSDVAPAAAPSPRTGGAARGVAATQVFQGSTLDPVPAAPAVAGGSRRVPQWLFLDRLFRDVLLADPAPSTVARSARQVGVLRRAGLAGAGAVALIMSLGSTCSFVRNKDALLAARDLQAVAVGGMEVPPEEALARLETLRAHLERLSRWRRWGFYKGTSLYPNLRRIYRDRFDRLLLDPARLAVLRSLDSLQATPRVSSHYSRAYGLLKAYLMTTSHPEHLDGAFLAPVLMETWVGSRPLDAVRDSLARAQFEFYADRLCRGQACAIPNESRAVTRTQRFLESFEGIDAIYELVLADAGGQQRPAAFARAYPSAAAVVTDRYEVPPAFTPRGWESMQQSLRDVGRFSQADDWVRGSTQRRSQDPADLSRQLRRRYVADYVQHWRSFLANASVARFGTSQEAAQKLGLLISNESPLLQLFAFVSTNTNVDSQLVGSAFQPVHVVVPPQTRGRLIVEGNQPYIGALTRLRTVLSQVSVAPSPDAVQKTMDAAAAVREAVGALAGAFEVDSTTREVSSRVTTLLEAPIVAVERMAGRQPANAKNAQGEAFCNSIRGLLMKYPFRRDASAEATLAEVSAVFEPNSGSLWRFFNESLQDVLAKQGSQYLAKPGAPMTPTAAFRSSFSRLASVTDALWPAGATQPRFDFTVKLLLPVGLDTALFNVDGTQRRFTRFNVRSEIFTWSASSPTKRVHLSTLSRGREETQHEFPGPWALFRILQRARWQTSGPTSTIQWGVSVQGRPLTVEAEVFLGAAWSLAKGEMFLGTACVGQVVP